MLMQVPHARLARSVGVYGLSETETVQVGGYYIHAHEQSSEHTALYKCKTIHYNALHVMLTNQQPSKSALSQPPSSSQAWLKVSVAILAQECSSHPLHRANSPSSSQSFMIVIIITYFRHSRNHPNQHDHNHHHHHKHGSTYP